jgi:hypothetical protein
MKQMKAIAAGLALSLSALSASPALAGPYGDELAKCLVKSTSSADKNFLVKWIFSIASVHPEVQSIASVSEAQRAALSKNAAKLFERLLTESCRAEAQQAFKYEGSHTLESSFSVLGQVAGRELFSNPSVAKGLADFANQIDKQKVEKLFGAEK